MTTSDTFTKTQCHHSTERWQITGGGPNHSDACATTKTSLNLCSTNTVRLLYKLYTVNIHLIFLFLLLLGQFHFLLCLILCFRLVCLTSVSLPKHTKLKKKEKSFPDEKLEPTYTDRNQHYVQTLHVFAAHTLTHAR